MNVSPAFREDTANAMNEWVNSQMFNDPDKGCFVAPPV
jgi:hypothetical protein